MLSAVTLPERSQPAVPRAGQLAHQRFVRPGPLVLGTGLLKSPARAEDRDRTVSRRSKPSSRRADIEVPNHAVDMDSWAGSACYPRGTFYPLSDDPPTRDRRITSSYFRTCSTCQSRSQAPLCTYTQHLVTDQDEGTFERLRYNLGGNRPS